ncbi:MAG: hypothetical protein LBU98_03040 [Alistipes sp.]|jgi:hypothetical protein|nr:hypothetical protein [Alistipes sp.]
MKIRTFDISKLRSNEHFQFITDVSALVGGLPAASAARVRTQIAAFAAGVAEGDAVL